LRDGRADGSRSALVWFRDDRFVFGGAARARPMIVAPWRAKRSIAMSVCPASGHAPSVRAAA
jgi:hypothetical protein